MTIRYRDSLTPISRPTRTCLEWRPAHELAFRMWDIAGTRQISQYLLDKMAEEIEEWQKEQNR